jgi:hypothetical protein
LFRFKPSIKKYPVLINRYLELRSNFLAYFISKPNGDSSAPSLTIPLSEIKRALYFQEGDLHLFELILNSSYEDIFILSKVQTHVQRNTIGAIGYSTKRIGKVPLVDFLLRNIPGRFSSVKKINEDSCFL